MGLCYFFSEANNRSQRKNSQSPFMVGFVIKQHNFPYVVSHMRHEVQGAQKFTNFTE